MKTVVIGGTGLIGAKLVKNLREKGHEALPASPSSGVNTITGEGLAEALARAQVIVDLANAPAWEDQAFWSSSRPRAATCSRRSAPPTDGLQGGKLPPATVGSILECRIPYEMTDSSLLLEMRSALTGTIASRSRCLQAP